MMSDEPKNSNSQPANGSPSASSTAPVWLLVLTLLLMFLGFVYFDRHGGWFDANVYSPYVSADELDSYQPKSGAAAVIERGKKLYEVNCGICHGADGLGKPGQFPPLAGSEWVMAKGVQRLTHIPLEGLNGPIQVKGEQMSFPAGMAAMGAALPDADLAAVLTYIRSAWGNGMGEVTPDDVKAVRASIGGHPEPMTAEELMKMPE